MKLSRATHLLAISDSSSGGLQPNLLIGAIGSVLAQDIEELSSSVLVHGMRELGDGEGNLEVVIQD